MYSRGVRYLSGRETLAIERALEVAAEAYGESMREIVGGGRESDRLYEQMKRQRDDALALAEKIENEDEWSLAWARSE